MKKWINYAKFVAILAVLVDHSSGVLYQNRDIIIASYFSVSLFVILLGMTSFYSYEKKIRKGEKVEIYDSIKKICVPYMGATFVYQVIGTGTFVMSTYLEQLLYFNASGPFYYVCLYIQLRLIGYALYLMIKGLEKGYDVIILIPITIVSWWTTNNTNVFGIYGGGGILLGGTYLILYCLGMLFAKYDFHIESKLKSGLLTLFTIVVALVYWKFECVNLFSIDLKIPFGNGINPPSISSFIMSITIAISVFSFAELTKDRVRSGMTIILKVIEFIGQHTLYIFLYHRLILDYWLMPYVVIDNIWIKRFFYLTCMILIPIAFEYMLRWMKEKFRINNEKLYNND